MAYAVVRCFVAPGTGRIPTTSGGRLSPYESFSRGSSRLPIRPRRGPRWNSLEH
jgi:hypothetical protein